MTKIFGGVRSLPAALAQTEIPPEQQAQVKEAAKLLSSALSQRELNAETLDKIGVPSHLYAHVVFELFLSHFPGLRPADVHTNVAELAKAISEAPPLSPQAAGIAAFDKAFNGELRKGNWEPKPCSVTSVGRYRDAYGKTSATKNEIHLRTAGLLDYSEYKIYHDPQARSLSFFSNSRTSNSSATNGADDVRGVTNKGLQNLIAALEAYVLTDAERVAREGGEVGDWPKYVQKDLLPLLREHLDEVKLGRLKDAVSAALPASTAASEQRVTQAVSETIQGGATVGKVEPGFLGSLVKRVFG
jgi:hypothetical protein